MKTKTKTTLLSLSFLVGIILIWKLYVVLFNISEFMLPAPELVLSKLIEITLDGTLLSNAAYTSVAISTGFIIGSLLGFFGGVLLSASKTIERTLMPYIFILQSTPKVAFIPLLVIWFGLGFSSKLILIVLSVFFPVMLNTIMAFRSIDPSYYELMHILKAKKMQTIMKVKLPLSLPLIFAGLKVGMVQGVIGAIVSEWVSGQSGLGYLLVFGSTQFSSTLLIATILATTFVGLLFYGIILVIENILLFWHETKRLVSEA